MGFEPYILLQLLYENMVIVKECLRLIFLFYRINKR